MRLISRLLCLILVGILAWPPASGRPVTDLGSFLAPAVQAAPESSGAIADSQGLAPGRSKKANKQKPRDRDSRSDEKKDRRTRTAPVGDSASEPAALAIEGIGDCGPGLNPIGDTGRCTHGPDPAPPGVSRELIAGQTTAREVRQETAGVACEGDGQSGYRVQVIYAYDKSQTNRYNQVVGNIRIAAAGADELMRESSLAAGQEMHFLFVHDTQCNIDVQPVGFSSAAMLNFGTMIQTMSTGAQGRSDRIYLIFADTSSAGICGIGTMMPDDSDSPGNKNNRGPSYSRVDRNCWAPQTALHEMMHNLGGVQYSAPYSSGGGHCIDEWDVMCYSDTPNFPSMVYRCQDRAAYQNALDCNNDNYFNPHPAPGSYLDTHWNTADSVFLQAGATSCPDTASGCRGAISLSTSHSAVKSKKRIRVSATITNTTARNATITILACRGGDCSSDAGRAIATLSGSAPSTEWKATGKGRVTFVAQSTTSSGLVTSNPVTVNVKKAKNKKKH